MGGYHWDHNYSYRRHCRRLPDRLHLVGLLQEEPRRLQTFVEDRHFRHRTDTHRNVAQLDAVQSHPGTQIEAGIRRR